MRERVENPEQRASDLSAVLPEAIQLRRQQGGEEALGAALAPTVEAALRESVRKDPTTLADALFPVMGPAIRRSILQTLRQLFESFNEAMEQSLSLRGLQWRFEALRTGRPFSEIVLVHSLVFRVEQVFLIHKKTGLPLCHVVAPAVAMEDPSLVSGMLSAIQDFVRDSFHSPQGQAIEKLQIGELEVWVEEGPHAVVAAVIRGMAPAAYRSVLVEAVERVHRKFAQQLQKFQGETAPFASATDDLAPCLEARYREKQSLRPKPYMLVFACVLLALLGGWWAFSAVAKSSVASIRGIARAAAGYRGDVGRARHGGHFVISGLRDPLSCRPAGAAANQRARRAPGGIPLGLLLRTRRSHPSAARRGDTEAARGREPQRRGRSAARARSRAGRLGGQLPIPRGDDPWNSRCGRAAPDQRDRSRIRTP